MCLSACCELQTRELYQRVVELTHGHLPEDEMQKIFEKHPMPEEVEQEQEVTEEVKEDA